MKTLKRILLFVGLKVLEVGGFALFVISIFLYDYAKWARVVTNSVAVLLVLIVIVMMSVLNWDYVKRKIK